MPRSLRYALFLLPLWLARPPVASAAGSRHANAHPRLNRYVQRLLVRAEGREPVAQRALFALLDRVVRRAVRRELCAETLSDRHLVEDLTQQTLVRLIQRIARRKLNGGHSSAPLDRIQELAAREVRMWRAGSERRRVAALASEPASPGARDQAARHEYLALIEDLRLALDELEPHERAILIGRAEGRPLHELAIHVPQASGVAGSAGSLDRTRAFEANTLATLKARLVAIRADERTRTYLYALRLARRHEPTRKALLDHLDIGPFTDSQRRIAAGFLAGRSMEEIHRDTGAAGSVIDTARRLRALERTLRRDDAFMALARERLAVPQRGNSG